ncbi:hypothetical protein [Nocardiopsis valliformis]|uniref:hypothetical protein n=1 Tax=Nocardiopsis valliformis TaxID=239974 RepID=UPI0003691750|nr:hypothetical protein [Nocardiopsis valliformis]
MGEVKQLFSHRFAHHHPQRTPSAQYSPPCTHPSCRERRAERLPRLGGHRSEYASEHTQAARIQARYRRLVIWWGESTRSFWVANPAGLEEATDIDALLVLLWPHTDPPTTRPWAQNLGRPRPRVPAAV